MNDLPGILSDVQMLCGREVALRLALAQGGQILQIPRGTLQADHPLLRALGADARIVAQHFAGETIYVPLARRQTVRYLIARGETIKSTARILGVSTRTIQRHVS